MLFGAVTAVNIWIAVFSDVTAEWSGRWLPVCGSHLVSRSCTLQNG